MYDKYKDKGFVILGFPCNQVSEILDPCDLNCAHLLISSVVKNLAPTIKLQNSVP